MALTNLNSSNNLQKALVNNKLAKSKVETKTADSAAKTDAAAAAKTNTSAKGATINYEAKYDFPGAVKTTTTAQTGAANATNATTQIPEFQTMEEAKAYVGALMDEVLASGDIEYPSYDDSKGCKGKFSSYNMSMTVKVGGKEYTLSNYWSDGPGHSYGYNAGAVVATPVTTSNPGKGYTPKISTECEDFLNTGAINTFENTKSTRENKIDYLMWEAISYGKLESPATMNYRDVLESCPFKTADGKQLYYERSITSKCYTTDEGLEVRTSNSIGGQGPKTGYLVDADGNKYQEIDGKIVPVNEKTYKFPDLIDMTQDKKDMEAQAKKDKMVKTQTPGIYSKKLANGQTVYYVWNSNDKQFERKNDIASITDANGGYIDRNGQKHASYNDQWIQAHVGGYTPTVEEGLFFKDGVYFDYNEATGKFEPVDISLYEVVENKDDNKKHIDTGKFDKANVDFTDKAVSINDNSNLKKDVSTLATNRLRR